MTGLTPPLQTRSRRTLDRLIEACETLLQEKRFEDISVTDLAKRARSSVGAFYGRFRDKDTLLDVLDQKSERKMIEGWDGYFSPGKWKGASTEEILRQFVRLSIRSHREKKGTLRTLFLRLRGQPTEEMLSRARRINRKVVEGLGALVASRRDEIAHPDPELAVVNGLVMVVSAIREWVVFEDLRLYPSRPSDDELAEELARAFVAYLGAGSGRSRKKPGRKKK